MAVGSELKRGLGMSANRKCSCGAYFEPDICCVCQEKRWIDEIENQKNKIQELKDAMAGMLAMYAMSPNDDDWTHPAVKRARGLIGIK